MASTWIDRAVGFLAPERGLRRARARVATDVLLRHYEAASIGRRTQGWKRTSGDVNAATGPALERIRDSARDLVRNNGHAESALAAIVDHVVSWGITAKPKRRNKRLEATWKAWSESTACDSDGRHDFAGIQKLALRTVVEAGEVLVRRRLRRPEDGLPIPLQLQVLEADYLDSSRNRALPNGGRIIQGVELDPLGRRVAYWLHRTHPGANILGSSSWASTRVPAEGVIHMFRADRPGQMRGPSWFSPVLLKFKDYDEYDDATLMKQKIAACLAVITTDASGLPGSGIGDKDPEDSTLDQLGPGAVLNIPAGRSVEVVRPPSVREFSDYSRATLRAIATGLGVSYEDLTGDYSNVNYSSARMARLRHWSRVEDWRWRMVIPQLCEPVWAWAMQAATIAGVPGGDLGGGDSFVPMPATWSAPPLPMIEPDKEGLAYTRNVRAGLMSLSEALRERGYDPTEVLEEIASDNELLDELDVTLDSDPRKRTQAGNPVTVAAPSSLAPTPEPDPADDDAADE